MNETVLPELPELLVLYDGVCEFCHWSTGFVLAREGEQAFYFAPLQTIMNTELGMQLLEQYPNLSANSSELNSMVLLVEGRMYERSDAVLEICGRLRWPWCWLRIFKFVPRGIRDSLYDWFGRHRYRWFGKADVCIVPADLVRHRFLKG